MAGGTLQIANMLIPKTFIQLRHDGGCDLRPELGHKTQTGTVSHPRSQVGGLGQANHCSAMGRFASWFPGSLQE